MPDHIYGAEKLINAQRSQACDFQLEGNIHIRTHVILIQQRRINNASECCLIIYGGKGVKKRQLEGTKRVKTGKKKEEEGPDQTLPWLTQLQRLHFLRTLMPVSDCIFIIPNSILTSAPRRRRGIEAPGAPEVTESCVIVG